MSSNISLQIETNTSTDLSIDTNESSTISITPQEQATLVLTQNTSGGTTNYNALLNKPQINGVELIGNKTSEELGISATINYTITYDELKVLRDSSALSAGCTYRITDYLTTSTQENTQSAGHQFDIIVKALDENTLEEEANAIHTEGDTYFVNNNLSGWKLWYTLDNDTSRFAWASEDGKGIIYRMIDEYGNDCPYDFKNIQMLNANNSEDTTYYYTFDTLGEDLSLDGSQCYDNVIGKYIDGTQKINRIIFISRNHKNINNNYFDTLCYNNTLDGACRNLHFERECYGNVFGYGCTTSNFGTKFRNNVVGGEVQSIEVGKGASNNTFGSNIYYCTFGTYFRNNKLPKYLYYSSFGHYVQNITMNPSDDLIGQYMRYLTFENGVTYLSLTKEDTATKSYMENIKICSGVKGTSSSLVEIVVPELAQKYTITYGNNSSGELKKYCEADFTDIPTYEDGDEVSY